MPIAVRGEGPRQNPLMAISLVTAIALFACAPTHHTPDPYRGDVQAARLLERRAASACETLDGVTPERPFVTDGCSLWPDGVWVDCCVEHDIPYWCGGSPEARLEADRRLRACVSDASNGAAGWLMFIGVRAGGHPVWPTPWGWGFGHPWSGGYSR